MGAAASRSQRTNQGNYLSSAARLKPGITLERARAEMQVAGDAFRRADPKWMGKTEGVAVIPMRDSVLKNVKPALLILLGKVAFVDPRHVLTIQTSLAGGRYASTAKENEFTLRALRRIENIPGIEAATTSIGKPPKGGDMYNGDEQWRSVTPHYLAVSKIPLLRGRFVQETDTSAAAKIVVINQVMAKKYWSKENPVRRQCRSRDRAASRVATAPPRSRLC